MTTIIWPNTTTETIDAIRGAIGRDITFYSEERIACTGCSIDPYTDTSTDVFCAVCSGVGYIITYSGYTVDAHVLWNPADKLMLVTGGQLDQGDCRVQIKFADGIQTVLDNTEYVVVDDRKLQIKNSMLRGVPTVNRVIINLMEIERDD